MEIHHVAPEDRRFSRFHHWCNGKRHLVSPLRRRRRIAAGNFFLETAKIDCLARTVDAKENNTSDRHEGINHESRFNFSRRDRLSEDFAKMHKASCMSSRKWQARELRWNLSPGWEMGQGEKKRSRRRYTRARSAQI